MPGEVVRLPYAQRMEWAWSWVPKIKTARAVTVFLYLVDKGGKEGECWHGRATIARNLGCGETAVKGGAKRLIDMGLLRTRQERKGGKWDVTIYTLLDPDGKAGATVKAEPVERTNGDKPLDAAQVGEVLAAARRHELLNGWQPEGDDDARAEAERLMGIAEEGRKEYERCPDALGNRAVGEILRAGGRL